MIVSEEDFQKELESIEKKENSLVVEQLERGRGNTPEIPEPLREIIAEDKLLGGTAKDISAAYGVSASSIAAYSHGNTSTSSYNKPVDKLTQVRDRVSSRAANRLNQALKALANKNLELETAKDISTIAKDMATVFEKISPVVVKEKEDSRALHIHMYAPKMKQVNDYKIIDVNGKVE